MPPVKESDIEKAIREYALALGCLFYKFTCPGQRGVPDRIVVAPNGVVGFLEIKKPGGEIRPQQIRRIKDIQDRRVPAAIVDNIDSGKQFIDALLDPRRFSQIPTHVHQFHP